MTQNEAAGVLAVAIVTVLLIVILLRSPMRRAAKVLLNSALGFLAMVGLNYAGVLMAVIWITVLAAGVFGLPGLILVALLQKVFG